MVLQEEVKIHSSLYDFLALLQVARNSTLFVDWPQPPKMSRDHVGSCGFATTVATASSGVHGLCLQ